MLVLAFDTSSRVVEVSLASSAQTLEQLPVSSVRDDAPNAHGERLAPMIAELLASCGHTPSDLDAIGVGLGPGPFTGLRVGVVTAKTMGDALGIPTYGVCSLDVIAAAHAHTRLPFAVVTDARRKQVYWRRYDAAGEPNGPPDIAVPAELADRLRGQVEAVVGAGVDLYPDAFAGFARPQASPTVEGGGFPGAAVLAGMVLQRALVDTPSENLVPMYLRRPDAQPPGRPKQVTPA